ncbi:MAG: FHA domain-containing protein [Pseudomonadota bacterium]
MSQGNEPLRLMSLLELARKATPDVFAVRLGGGPVLVRQQPAEEDEDGWSFNTASRLTAVVDTAPGRELVLHSDDLVHVVRKAHVGAAFARTILIGRADSNDIRLPHPSVSKLHARIQRDPQDRYLLSDAASQNGTQVEGRRLEADESVELTEGAWIRMGDLSMCYLTLDRFYEVVRRIH